MSSSSSSASEDQYDPNDRCNQTINSLPQIRPILRHESTSTDAEVNRMPRCNRTFINWFCTRPGNSFFTEIDHTFLNDPCNLRFLNEKVIQFEKTLLTILGAAPKYIDPIPKERFKKYTQLYGLIHARFVSTLEGLWKVFQKYDFAEYGTCPRVICDNERLLPIGLTDELNCEAVALYCGSCDDVFKSEMEIDGAFFGTGLPHLFFMQFPRLRAHPPVRFVPRISGFQIHSSAMDIQLNGGKPRIDLVTSETSVTSMSISFKSMENTDETDDEFDRAKENLMGNHHQSSLERENDISEQHDEVSEAVQGNLTGETSKQEYIDSSGDSNMNQSTMECLMTFSPQVNVGDKSNVIETLNGSVLAKRHCWANDKETRHILDSSIEQQGEGEKVVQANVAEILGKTAGPLEK